MAGIDRKKSSLPDLYDHVVAHWGETNRYISAVLDTEAKELLRKHPSAESPKNKRIQEIVRPILKRHDKEWPRARTELNGVLKVMQGQSSRSTQKACRTALLHNLDESEKLRVDARSAYVDIHHV
jgi:hypothetical protein